jgi:hypothetical protein
VRIVAKPDQLHRDFRRAAGSDPEVRSALQYLRDRSLDTHVALATKR